MFIHVSSFELQYLPKIHCAVFERMTEKLQRKASKDQLKRPICPFLEVGLEKLFDSHL